MFVAWILEKYDVVQKVAAIFDAGLLHGGSANLDAFSPEPRRGSANDTLSIYLSRLDDVLASTRSVNNLNPTSHITLKPVESA